MALGYYSFTVGAENGGQTLKTFLRRECGLSARSMTVLKYAGMGITRSGTELRAHDIVRTGDRIEIQLPRETNDIPPVEGELDILYEDRYLLIVNKPAAMPVHPTKVHQLDTLANIVAYHQQKRGEVYTFRALNRLDKDTSGCVLIAKDRVAYAQVLPTIAKRYIAVCEGMIASEGTINAPIALQEGSTMRRCVRADGAAAVTHYRPIKSGSGHTLCELCLETGRTHQIRCHMSHIGHPLAGDDLYGGSRRYIHRQALHCAFVRFCHPVTHEEMAVEAAVPTAFEAILSAASPCG